MSLQFILGGAGSGKSTYLYQNICKQASENPHQNFYILVPEQFTLETQKTLVKMSQGQGIMNIDVLSFNRLAYRVFEEFPALARTILEDMGKTMVLQKILSKEAKNLVYFKKGISKPGFLDELKSFLCELLLYRIGDDEMERMIAVADEDSLLERKLQDLKLIYQAFREYMGEDYMTAEELLPQLSKVIAGVDMLRDSIIALDGFTGFTPVQYELLTELMKVSEEVRITLTVDGRERRKDLFRLSTDTMTHMGKICSTYGITMNKPVILGQGKDLTSYRFAKGSALSFLERNLFSYDKTTYAKKQDQVSVTALGNPRDESRWVARKIYWLVAKEGYRYEDIAVVTGDLAGYQEYLAPELEVMGIRYFMDYKKGIGGNAFSEFVMSFLEMLRKNMDYESTIRFLRCGLSPFSLEEVDTFENVILALGKRGFNSYDQPWKAPYHGKDKYDMEVVNECRQRLVDMIRESREAFRGKRKTVEEYVRALYDFIVANQVYEKLCEEVKAFEEQGQMLLAKEYKSVYTVMMKLLDQMVELLGDEKISFADFRDLLGAGISEGLVGFTPPSMDQVVVGDVERSRLKDIKVLFFIGVNDGIIPKGSGTPGVLSDREREALKKEDISLAPSGRDLIFTEQFYMYLNLTKPSQRLYLSYSRMGTDGGSMRPSYLVSKVRKLLAPLAVCQEDNEDSYEKILGTDQGRKYLYMGLNQYEEQMENKRFEQLYAYYLEKEPQKMRTEILPELFARREDTRLSKEAIQLLYGDQLQGSVTRLENFGRCPFAHFVSYGLKLSKREEFQIGSMDFGNVFHQSLENFSKMLHDRQCDWKDLDDATIPDMVNHCVEEAVENYKDSIFEQSMRSRYVVHRIHRIMERTVSTMVEQMKKTGFTQRAYEISFQALDHLDETHLELDDGKGMNLLGRIDRIDTLETDEHNYVRVIDYKTGNTSFELASFYYGLQMQLVVYLETAMAMEERQTNKKVKPAGMFYYHVKDPMLKVYTEDDVKRREMFQKELALDGFALEMGGDGVSNGIIAKTKNRVSEDKMNKMIEHTRGRMKEFGNEILKGNKDVKPYMINKKTGCDYCEYKGICNFDIHNPGDDYRELKLLNEETIWGYVECPNEDGRQSNNE